MDEPGGDLGLVGEHAQEARLLEQVWVQPLDRDGLREPADAGDARAPHLGHAALGDALDELEEASRRFDFLDGQRKDLARSKQSLDEALTSDKRGIRALKLSLLALGVTAALQLVVVFFSSSVALLADTVHNFSDALMAIPLTVPLLSLLVPVLGAATFTHLFHRLETTPPST